MPKCNIVFRATPEIVAALDATAARIEANTPGATSSRSAVLRAVLEQALGLVDEPSGPFRKPAPDGASGEVSR